MRARVLVTACAIVAGIVTGSSSVAHAAEEIKDAHASAPTTSTPPSTVTPPNAEDKPIVVWPTLTPAGDDPSGTALHRPLPGDGTIHARAVELDATLRDAVQDLGFTLDVADPGPAVGHARDLDMLERAQHSGSHMPGPSDSGTWLVSPRLEHISGDSFLLRIVVVPPRSKQLRVRVERVSEADVPVRGLVLLRDLLSSAPGAGVETTRRPDESAAAGIMTPSRSPGRAVLAANAALFGAFMAFSVQRASGSEDPRLLYPLLTLGTGVGLGSALLVAEEWNVSTGDAWTLAGGAWWGAASGIFIANGRNVQPLTDRYAWGVGGGLIGLGLATFSLTRSKADEGDAVLVHSGAGLGLGLGALSDYFYRGDLNQTPYTGAGYGSAIGLVLGGSLAKLVKLPPSRVLLVDLGAGVGAAAGAAIGSPLVFEKVTPEKTRGFVAATFGGTLIGGVAAWWFTRDRPHAPAPSRSALRLVPYGGTIGASQTRQGVVPAYGLGVNGTW
jgi:hypothetical protein